MLHSGLQGRGSPRPGCGAASEGGGLCPSWILWAVTSSKGPLSVSTTGTGGLLGARGNLCGPCLAAPLISHCSRAQWCFLASILVSGSEVMAATVCLVLQALCPQLFFSFVFSFGHCVANLSTAPSGEGRLWHSRCHRPSRLLAMEWLRILQSLVSTSSVLSLPPEVLEVSQKPPELSWARAGRGAGHSGSLAAVPQSH